MTFDEAQLVAAALVFGQCELCRDPWDKPYLENGRRVWRRCENTATREVIDGSGRLRICEEHFKGAAS